MGAAKFCELRNRDTRGRKADERDIRYKAERRRYFRNNPRDFSRAGHRAGDPDLSVSAVQYPLWLDEGDAAGRRLPVRVEIHLWLQPVLAAAAPAAVLGARPGQHAARARRCGGIPPAERHLDRL